MTTTVAVVTGGAGFIGSALARRLLDDGARVRVIDAMVEGSGANRRHADELSPRLDRFIEADIGTGGAWETAFDGATRVFHLAAQISHEASMRDPLADLSSNAAGTLRVLEAVRARAPDAVVVFTSTRQVYGRARSLPVAESHPVTPPDVNAVNKLAAEEFCRLYGRVYGTRGVILRLTNTYGPGMRVRDARQTFLGHWVRLALEGGEIPIFGDGTQVRDLSYVDDVVSALLAAAGVGTRDVPVFNVGGEEHTLLELAQLVIGIAGQGTHRLIPFPPERARIDIGSFRADDSALRAATGWRPAFTVDRGLEKTMAYFRTNGRHYW
ncbi:MAG: NAD-dependent epimerase/dehydratase family protein [Gemmatimonadetes bacterium]|nr:NAD-dependent epimerase/dehydratase family protein [Gemmatimonadota bacterium]